MVEEFLKRLKTVHMPSKDEPWLEQEYTDYSDFRLFAEFIRGFDNIAKLRQEDQPFFFRGQADGRWTLKPKVVRLLEGIRLDEALKYEHDSIRYFQERAHLFSSSRLSEKDDILE
jgi:hypothetical protein